LHAGHFTGYASISFQIEVFSNWKREVVYSKTKVTPEIKEGEQKNAN